MNKKLKITTLILVLLFLTVGGTLLYVFKFKEYDVADEEAKNIIEDPYRIEMPDGTSITQNHSGEVGESAGTVASNGEKTMVGTTSDNDKQPSSNGGSNSTSSKTNTTGTNQEQTVESIKLKYNPVLENLQSQADHKLNTLVSHAKKEYGTKKAAGESISYGYFYTKYVGISEKLEANTDAAFADVIIAVEKDLEASGYSKSHAKSFTEDYNAKKKARKDSLMKKALGQ